MVGVALLATLLGLLLGPVADERGVEEAVGPLGVVDVGLDPGHSDFDVGAVGGGLREVDLTLTVASRVKELLAAQGLTVAMSRSDSRPLTDFSNPDPTEQIRIEQEARIAAVGKARIYVSIHFNGYGDPRVRGTETYYNGDNCGEDSRRLARSIQENVVSTVRASGYAVPDRGVKEDLAAGKPYGHFFSLRGGLPSVLVESMFLTNPEEAALLHDDATLETIAEGIASGIEAYLSPSRPQAAGTMDQ